MYFYEIFLKNFFINNYKENVWKKELYFFIKIFFKIFMKNLVRGQTRNREVQGWDAKILHFFKQDFYIIQRKYFIK